MINDHIQKQQGGDHSTNVQAESVTINGISYSDARTIALDVYKANFLELSQSAAQLARARAEELTDSFLSKLKEEHESAISELQQPAMQAALYEAQKQYAKTGDADLEGMLVDILVQRASTPERNTKQIVLDEALEVVSKLTPDQLDMLSMNFALTRLSRGGVTSQNALVDFFTNELLKFGNGQNPHQSWVEHLAYSGCVTLMDASWYKEIPELILGKYPAMFQKGFDEEQFVASIGDSSEKYKSLLKHSYHTVSLLEFNLLTEGALGEKAAELGFEEQEVSKLKSLFTSNLMNKDEVKDWLVEKVPGLTDLINNWGGEDSRLSKMQLTTVGIALAQANYTRKVNIKFDLGIWVK
ncbi:hypothetical protein FB443_1011024 [Vibrio crassostreae]|uniref:LPO_1073/Vpar_1526 family protein n=1 Tax=Vibrio crassostreae TaxID=246167 RepID=UPI000F4A35F0|nr:LPO_1073/Vpar_1526 family protein [Vibrio crassostreae]ROR87527.1 hypothetical protein EDB66_0458 [Vibrio crassostreae]TQL46080.1 hypothetical protein FB443_1011024 [Vibrio crassostreae]